MRTEILDISPAMAKGWLENNNTSNRKIIQGNVNKYARDMSNGKWSLTHQGVAFYKSGRFADGQHRLMAIVKSDCTVQMMVTFDIDDAASMDIDGVKTRSAVDQANISGVEFISNEKAAVIKLLIALNNGRSSISSHELVVHMATIRSSLNFAFTNLSIKKKYLSSAPVYAAVALAHFNGENESRLSDFCGVFIFGIVESLNDVAAIRLRDYLLNTQGIRNGGGGVRKETTLRTQRAIKAFCANEKISKLMLPSSIIYPVPESIK